MSGSTSQRRTQAERRRASQEKIIQAATQLFAQQGFRGAKMAEIAKAAQLSEPGLLHHFPSKTALLMAVLAERDRADQQRFTPSQPGAPGDFLASLTRLVEHNQTLPGLVQLFTILVAESLQDEHPAHDFFKQRYQQARLSSLELLRQGQERGEIRADLRAEDLIVLLFALMDGLQIQWLFEPETIDMPGLFDSFVRLLRSPSAPAAG